MATPPIRQFLISASLFLLGCNNQASVPNGMSKNTEGEGGHHLSLVRSAEIVPSPLTLDGAVAVRMTTESFSRGNTAFKYSWYINDTLVSGKGEEKLEPELLKRGDRVYAEITSVESDQEGPIFRTLPVTVANTPPSIKAVAFEPNQAKRGDKLLARVEAVDPDREEVHLWFKWWRNERLVLEGEDDFLDTTGYARGDRIVVSVTPRDGQSHGVEFYSQPYTLSNGFPQFVETGHPRVVEGRLDYTAKATDPENDPLSFSLEIAPAGMAIDEQTGHISWTVPAEAKGSYRAKVVVKDDHGGWASQELDLSVTLRAAALE